MKAPCKGRIQMRKTNYRQLNSFSLQSTAGPYRRVRLVGSGFVKVGSSL